MRESAFIRRNQDRWAAFEEVLQDKNARADTIADLFVKVTDDLAYSRTYYPDSKTTRYLNFLAAHVHQSIYKNKREKISRVVTYWAVELPLMFRSVHRELLIATLIFGLATLIGIVSTLYDEDFPRIILGDSYVNMTIENIKRNDPMAVYKSMAGTDMFFYISLNNIMVSFYTFAAGLATPFGTAYFLMRNGIMLGAFQTFFFRYDLLIDTLLVIWIHGTLEISAIVIAGAAGIVMGNGILFPGTYTRTQSFVMGAKRGAKIAIGLVPVFLVAAFLESFVTRLTEMHDLLKILIILLSAAFIIGYFVVYPIWLSRRLHYHKEQETHSVYALTDY